MFKKTLSKKKLISTFIMLIMVLSAFVVISSGASATASGTVTYTPTVFSINVPTLTAVSGGSFGSGSTVYFYLSSTTSSSGIIGSYIGLYTLSGGLTSLSNNHLTLTIPSTVVSGTYYILASDSASSTASGAQFTAPASVTVTSLLPSFSVSGTQPTTSGTITGSGWDAGASISLYLAGADGTPLNYIGISSFVASASGSISAQFTVPNTAKGSYTVICEENTGTNAGITADSTMTISPIILVSPADISGASGTSITVTGYGFLAYATISASTINAGGVTISNPATTTSSIGYFSVSGALASAITTSGPQYVTVTYNTSSYQQTNAFYVSIPNPAALEFTFSVTSSSGYYYPNSPFNAIVYNFPASSTVSIMLGSILLGSITTDSNGYGTLSGTLPAMISSSYYATAVFNGLYKTSSITISAYYKVIDPSGNLMTSTYSEYMPSNGTYTVIAYGLNPLTDYPFGTAASHVVSVSVGSYSSITSEFTPALNGTLIFTYKSVYTGLSTGTPESISLSGVTAYNGLSFEYKAVGAATYSSVSIMSIFTPAKSESFTISNIISQGANVYSGLSYIYNVYLGTSELSFTTLSGSTSLVMSSSTSSSSTGTLTFTVPSLSSGVYNLTLVYNGQNVANAVYSLPVIVSVAGTSPSSGTLTVVPITISSTTTIYIAGAGYYGTSVSLYYMTYTAVNGPYTETLTSSSYGAFSYSFTMPSEPAGSYAVFTVLTYVSQSYYVYAYYNVLSTLSLTTQSGGISASVSFTLSGFSANSYYTVYFGNINVGTYLTGSTGSLTSSFNVPVVLAGTYTVSVTPINSNSVITSTSFKVIPSTTLTLNTNNYAFPGQLVNFTWTPTSSLPNQPSSSTSTSPYYGPVYVTVYLNNSAYSTFIGFYSATGLMGSFNMPNNASGSYYEVTLSWSQDIYTTTITTTTPSTTSTVTTTETYMMPSGNGAYLGLVQGNGALITGITSSEIATLEVAINSTITSTMKVPISELNANITVLSGDIATITTKFGTMTATLQDINATVTAVKGTVLTIQTALGTVQTTLNAMNATVTSSASSISGLVGSVATITTSLGTISGTVTSISGGVATIQTNLGTLTTTVNSIKTTSSNTSTSVGNTMIFEIAVLVLIVVTLGMVVYSLGRKQRPKKPKEFKGPEVPKAP